ncbi:polysaccharide lyase family 14 protein, partial [Polychytrium aggregatum]|uniref:polysaccharide lyase family 14 protein n=1 Tax=Polychytrium aggregatum TaxID=110093 RepID=UPI0022FE07DE
YVAGSRNPAHDPVGGTGVYFEPMDLSQATTVSFEFQVFFPTGFNFVQGGKLPGLVGVASDQSVVASGCSGGNDALTCFSTRFMASFRIQGKGEIYLYVDQSLQADSFCSIPPFTYCNSDYGASIGRGSFYFATGQWNKVRQVISLNSFQDDSTPNQDGGVQVYYNDKLAISYDQVVWREFENVGFAAIDFETFFGGSDDSYDTPVSQYTYFKGLKLEVIN